MAFVLPLLIVLLFGIIEFSIILYDKAMVTHAAREGARYGVMWAPIIDGVSYKHKDTDIKSYVTDKLGTYLISFSSSDKANITTNQCINPEDILTVKIEYPYSFLLLPNFVNNLTNNVTLTSVAQMKCEQ